MALAETGEGAEGGCCYWELLKNLRPEPKWQVCFDFLT